MITVVAVDGGLATSGLVAVRTDGAKHRCLCADTFTSKPLARKNGTDIADDRTRRTRAWSRWFEGHLTRWAPAFVAAESMSYGARSHDMVVCVCLAWGAMCDQLELRQLELAHAGPRVWRGAISGGSERAAHLAAMRAVPSFLTASRRIRRGELEHARDALGVFVWSMTTSCASEALL